MQASFLVAKFPQVLAITHIDKETKGHPPPPHCWGGGAPGLLQFLRYWHTVIINSLIRITRDPLSSGALRVAVMEL